MRKYKKNKIIAVVFFLFLLSCKKNTNLPEARDTAVDNIKPTVSITSPTSGAVLRDTITITVTAQDNIAIDRVEFYLGETYLGMSKISPYSYTWNTKTVANGSYQLIAKAYDTNQKWDKDPNTNEYRWIPDPNVGVSTPVSITVSNVFAIISPVNNEEVFGNQLKLKASVDSSIAVNDVKFYYNTNNLIGTATLNNGVYTLNWDTTSLTNGVYTIKAVLTQTDNTTVEANISVTVKNETGSLINTVNFGTNPGNLLMYRYVPSGISTAKPLVVALHGCSQMASGYAVDTGWNTLADTHKFYVIYPQQKAENNPTTCFSWYTEAYQERGVRENLSIKQMIDKMKESYNISDVYITGFSAGGAMTALMLATYPEVFKGGAILAGIAYKIARNVSEAGWVMDGQIDKTATDLGNLVRMAYPGYTGPYPNKIVVFQGTLDSIVDKKNMEEILEQWGNVHGFTGNVYTEYSFTSCGSAIDYECKDYSGKIRTYSLIGMGHAVPVSNTTGKSIYTWKGTSAIDSSTKAAQYWGIIP